MTDKEKQLRRIMFKQVHKFGNLNDLSTFYGSRDFSGTADDIEDIGTYKTHYLKNGKIIIRPFYRTILICSLMQINDVTVNAAKSFLSNFNDLLVKLYYHKISTSTFENKFDKIPVNSLGQNVKRLVVDYFNVALLNIYTCAKAIGGTYMDAGSENYSDKTNQKMMKKAKELGTGKCSSNRAVDYFVPLTPLAPNWVKYPLEQGQVYTSQNFLLRDAILTGNHMIMALLGESDYKLKSPHKYELALLKNMNGIVKEAQLGTDPYSSDLPALTRNTQIKLYIDSYWLSCLVEGHYNKLPNPDYLPDCY